jgi:ethanolamine utilization protein EutN
MYLARVIGTVVATKKADNMHGLKLLLVQPCDADQQPRGAPHVAIDAVAAGGGGAGSGGGGGAGEGDFVTCVGSREAALSVQPSFIPVDAAIVGIVDRADRG